MVGRLVRLGGAVILVVASVIIAAAASLGSAMLIVAPPAFLAVGWIVLAGGTVLAARVARAGRAAAVVAVVLVTGVIGAFVAVPLGDAAQAPAEVPGIRSADLATGSRLAYVRVPAAGPPTGDPIVFLHGGPGVADMRGDLAFFSSLTETGREVILYDQVGAGHSSRLDDPTAYTLERDRADLEALLEQLGVERAVLIGHSYGGTLAAAFAAEHPDRVSGLVFLAPGAIREHPREYGTGMVDRLAPQQRSALNGLLFQPRALFGWLLTQGNPRAAHAFAGDREMDARYDRIYAASLPGLFCGSPPADVELPHGLGSYTNAMVRQIPDLRPSSARVDAPALVIKPQCDYLPWTFGTDLVTALPDARLVYLRDAGHSLYAERPDEVRGLIEAFLADEPLPIPPVTDLAPPADLDGPTGSEP